MFQHFESYSCKDWAANKVSAIDPGQVNSSDGEANHAGQSHSQHQSDHLWSYYQYCQKYYGKIILIFLVFY